MSIAIDRDGGQLEENYQEIYALSDPRTLAVRYIGMSNNALRRYKQHIASSHSLQLQAWNASLERFQLTPEILVIDEATTREDALEKEAFWIRWFLRRGAPLLNERRPMISEVRVVEIYESMWPHIWTSLEGQLGEALNAIASGHYNAIPFKALACLEWRLFNVDESYRFMVGRYDRKERERRSQERFGISNNLDVRVAISTEWPK